MILKMDIQDDMGYMVNLLRIIKNPDANLLSLLEYFQKEMGVQTPKPALEERPAAPAPSPASAAGSGRSGTGTVPCVRGALLEPATRKRIC